MENSDQYSEYVNKSALFNRVYEDSFVFSLNSSKNNSSGTKTKKDVNEKGTLKFSCSSGDKINQIKQRSEDGGDAVPVCENTAEKTSSSAIHYNCNADENKESCDVLKPMQKISIEDRKCENETNPKLDEHMHSNCYYGTGAIEREKKERKNDVILDTCSHETPDFAISETKKSEVTTAEGNEMLQNDGDDWEEITLPFKNCTFKEAQSLQRKTKAEAIGTTPESKKSYEKLLCNINLQDLEPSCNLGDKRKIKERDSSISFLKTICANMPIFSSFNIFSDNNHTVSENKTNNKIEIAEENEKSDENSLTLKESNFNKSADQFECKPTETGERDYENPSYSSYFAHSVADDSSLKGKGEKNVNTAFYEGKSENIFPVRDNIKANANEKTKNETGTIEFVNIARKSYDEIVFSAKDLDTFDGLNVEVQNNPKNITFLDSITSDNVLLVDKLNLAEKHLGVIRENTESQIHEKYYQNEKSNHSYSSSNEFETLDDTGRSEMKAFKLNEEIETNEDHEATTCTEIIRYSKLGCKRIIDKTNIIEGSMEKVVSQSFEVRDRHIKTLEDAMNYFNLSPVMEQLENSLQDVRRRKKSKEAHEIFLKDVDKQIQKLSYKFHPDRVRNEGSSEDEMKTAEKLQAAINAVRTALNILNDAFLEDIDIDHKYGFYTKLNLTSLANENELKSHVYEVLFQIGLLSDIKQLKIILEIQKFLAESQFCIKNYFSCNTGDFVKHRDLALFHLQNCIQGYKKLQSEVTTIENKCKAEKLDNIGCTINKVGSENHKILTHLRNLKRVAENSLAGSFQIFTTSETLDEYFLLPFVYYVNIMLMCSVMNNNKASRFGYNGLNLSLIDFKIFKINGTSFAHPYLLVLSFIDDKQRNWLLNENMSKEELKQEFDKYLECLYDHFKSTFKECDYSACSPKNYYSEELTKCTKMMFDFQMKEKELTRNIEKFKRRTEEVDEKYEKLMKQNEELSKAVKEQLEKSKKLSEKTSLAVSEKI